MNAFCLKFGLTLVWDMYIYPKLDIYIFFFSKTEFVLEIAFLFFLTLHLDARRKMAH